MWDRLLASHPDREYARWVCQGVREGFRLGFDWRRCSCRPASGNMRSVVDHREVVEKYIQGERLTGRLVGPLEKSSCSDVQLSPFGVIPKKEPGKWRLILDLSSPDGSSVNAGIEKSLCSVSYLSVDDTVDKVLQCGQGSQLAKFDIRSAYRNVPVHPEDRWLLGMVWDDQVYVDTTLPFGLRSAPKIFSAVADAFEFIIKEHGAFWVSHYLDDFVLIGSPGSGSCGRDLSLALRLADEVGFPVAEEKTHGPARVLQVLGVELDTVNMVVRLPEEKLRKLKCMLGRWRKRKCCTKKELKSLAGHLCNACKVVRPGRRFLRGFFGLISQFSKKAHMIRLNSAFRADLEWWFVYSRDWNGVSMMLKASWMAPEIEIWSDASGSWGCGAVWETKWFQVAWEQWVDFAVASIAAKELLPIIVSAAVWGSFWAGKTVLCHCDNMAVVAVIRGGYCKDSAMAHMLRCLFFLEAKFNFRLTAEHVAGVNNGVADAVSRNKLEAFFSLVPQASRVPCHVPVALVQRLVIQRPWTSVDWDSWLTSMSTNQ